MPHIDLIKELAGWFVFLMTPAIGNPIPEEILIISAGIRTAHLDDYGLWRWLMLPCCMLGALLADVILYGIGRVFGEVIKRSPWLSKLMPPDKQERIRENLHRYGVVIFVIGRMVPGFRTTLFLTAGSTRLPLWKFCIADGLGALVGTSLFFFMGFWLGDLARELVEKLERGISPYKTIILITLLCGVGGYLIYRYLRQPIPTGDPEEVPLIGHQIATALPTTPPENETAADQANEASPPAP